MARLVDASGRTGIVLNIQRYCSHDGPGIRAAAASAAGAEPETETDRHHPSLHRVTPFALRNAVAVHGPEGDVSATRSRGSRQSTSSFGVTPDRIASSSSASRHAG